VVDVRRRHGGHGGGGDGAQSRRRATPPTRARELDEQRLLSAELMASLKTWQFDVFEFAKQAERAALCILLVWRCFASTV
jgi:hypothetical protein